MPYSLRRYNTFGIEVTANRLTEFHSIDDIHTCIENGDFAPNNDVVLLGGGSNILFTRSIDHALLMRIQGREIVHETDEYIHVKFGAGENWHSCTRWAVENDYGGIENLALIPGTIGAAPIQNIGAYGMELADSFISASCILLSTNEHVELNRDSCRFGYRDSIFKHELKGDALITAVTLRLSKQHTVNAGYKDVQTELARLEITEPTIADVHRAVVAVRKAKLPDPSEIGNAGSFFKNPVVKRALYDSIQLDFQQKHPESTVPKYDIDDELVKMPAAWLIEQCGYKGIRRQAIGVHERQALVLVNFGGGSGQEVYDLAVEIQSAVSSRFAIYLSMEVNIL